MQTDQTELLAIHLYQSHCRAMDETEHLEFFTDPSFVKEANAWRTVAADALIYLDTSKAIAELNDRLINRREAYEEYIAKGKPHSQSELETVVRQIEQWGIDKGIIGPDGKGTIKKQADKMLEECHETRDAVIVLTDRMNLHEGPIERYRGLLEQIEDGIGDVGVTIILLAIMHKMTLLQCLKAAYSVISKRKGEMVDGTFVKEVEV